MNKFEYKNISPFKWFVLENFPFIENDFESINNYRLFSKVVEYLNNTIDNMNLTDEQMENVTNAMTNLQNYVNNYFDNLDVQDEIDNKLDEMATDGTLENIIAKYLRINKNCYVAVLTHQDAYTHDNDSYLGISFDGECFTPIPQTKNLIPVKSDVQIFKYNDVYLFAATTSSNSSNPNRDAIVGWTEDFEEFHFESVSLGFTQYRNTHFPEASEDNRRWTPRFYIDKENNLNMLLSMATNNTMEYDAYEVQQRTQMKIFHQTLNFTKQSNNFLSGRGDIDTFKVRENNNEIDTFFDGEIILHDNVFYFFYKNAHFNDVCVAISTTDDYSIFNAIKLNLFQAPYTEAPCITECNGGFLVYGQQYRLNNVADFGRNLLLYTKDFVEYIPVGYPRRLYSDYKIDGIMRNISPCLLTNNDLVTKLRNKVDVIGYGCYNDSDIKTNYSRNNYLNICKIEHQNGRTCSFFNNADICCNSSIEDVYINNFWNARNISIYGSQANMLAYIIQLIYNNIGDKVILAGSYPTTSFIFTNNYIRNSNRSFIPNSSSLINNSTDEITNETVILPNSQYAKSHIYQKNINAVHNVGDTICNVGVKNFQNEQVVFAMVLSSNNTDFPQYSLVPLRLYSNGDLKPYKNMSGITWKTDFIFMLTGDFYNNL